MTNRGFPVSQAGVRNADLSDAVFLGGRHRLFLVGLMVVTSVANASCGGPPDRYWGGQGGSGPDSSETGKNPMDAGNYQGGDKRLSANLGLVVEDFETARQDNADVCLLVDQSQDNRNLLGYSSSCFNNCGNNCPDITAGKIETSLTQTSEDALWCSGHSLILSYDVSDGVGGARTDRFAGYVVSLMQSSSCPCVSAASDAGMVLRSDSVASTCSGFDADGLNLNFVAFWVRFETDFANPDVEVAIKDVCLQQTTVKPRAMSNGSNGYVVDHIGAWSKVKIDLARMRKNGLDTRNLREISFTFAQGTGYAPTGRMYLDDVAFER